MGILQDFAAMLEADNDNDRKAACERFVSREKKLAEDLEKHGCKVEYRRSESEIKVSGKTPTNKRQAVTKATADRRKKRRAA